MRVLMERQCDAGTAAVDRNHKFFGESPYHWIAAFAVIGIPSHLILRSGFHPVDRWQVVPLWSVLLIGTLPLTCELVIKARRRGLGSDLLAGISIVMAATLGEYLAGALVVLTLSGG